MYVAASPIAGRGMFAAESISAGTSLHVAPVILLDDADHNTIDETGMSGYDELEGTADDYTLVLNYVGITNGPGCDVTVDFDDTETSFAVCQLGFSSFATNHFRITSAQIYFNTGFSWFFGAQCGNGSVETGEDCDDGGTADGDCCSSTCSFEALGSGCDDGVSCTTPDQCDGAGTCAGTPNDANCDDGAFCNGAETCDAVSDCQAGAPPNADDGVGCTDDSCDEVNDAIVNLANDANCDDGAFCNGAETCDAVSDCQAGAPPNADDGVGCTDDSCDEVNDAIVNLANDANCDDGAFCNGAETCNAVSDCQAGAPPNADDGVGCTDDSCDEVNDAIVNLANDANCDDGAFCNGAETCDAVSDCQAGAPPNADDGVGCTDDSCDEIGDMILNAPNDGNCDDQDPCTADTCDALLGCMNDPIPDCMNAVPAPWPWTPLALFVLVSSAAAALIAPPAGPGRPRREGR